jgi:hypothetical protein
MTRSCNVIPGVSQMAARSGREELNARIRTRELSLSMNF